MFSQTFCASRTLRRVVTAATAVAAFFALASAAQADIMICNDIRAPIHVALAYQAQDSVPASGWWSIAPNDCLPIDFQFQGATLYYAANSDGYRDGRTTSRDHWGNKQRLFVTKSKFDLDDASRARRGARAEMFSAAEISPANAGKPMTVTLRFTHGSTTVSVKTGK